MRSKPCILVVTIFLLCKCGSFPPAVANFEGANLYPGRYEFSPGYSLVHLSGKDRLLIESHNLSFRFAKGYKKKPACLPCLLTGSNETNIELIIPTIDPIHNWKLAWGLKGRVNIADDNLALGHAWSWHIGGYAFNFQMDVLNAFLTIPMTKSLDFDFTGKYIWYARENEYDDFEIATYLAFYLGL